MSCEIANPRCLDDLADSMTVDDGISVEMQRWLSLQLLRGRDPEACSTKEIADALNAFGAVLMDMTLLRLLVRGRILWTGAKDGALTFRFPDDARREES